MTASLILVGVGGFGAFHLANIGRLEALQKARLIAMVDPVVKGQRAADPALPMPHPAPLFNLLSEALAHVGVPDIVIVCVPIHLHVSITKEALLAGADVLLEKPPFASYSDFLDVLEMQQRPGRAVQVGFQSIGSLAIQALKEDDLDLGTITSVRATGCWLRRAAYWKRSRWVGKRSLGDVWTMDGVSTNALAHAVITALHVAGVTEASEVTAVDVEAYRSQAIDTDDTVTLRIRSTSETKILAALTLCASEQQTPKVHVVGSKASALFDYVTDTITVNGQTRSYGRVNLLENLIEHRSSGEKLVLPLRSTGSFMRVLDAVQTSGAPMHIERKFVDMRDTGDEAHPVIQDIEAWIDKAAASDALFSEVGAPWARTRRDTTLAQLQLGDHVLLDVLDGNGIAPTSSPRPYIHPIRTLAGVEVTGAHPADHDWHCGVGFVVPDVDGISFWGGGTYVHGKGYILMDNHGRIDSKAIRRIHKDSYQQSGLEHTLSWVDKHGHEIISEMQTLLCSPLSSSCTNSSTSPPLGWTLSFQTVLSASTGKVSLGGPGSNGRVGGGYGGFFWRLPTCDEVQIFSADAEGEEAVHGTVSTWLAWTGRFGARPGVCGHATLVFVPADAQSARDPWFVRCADYPGVGSAIAWDRRREIPEGRSITRSFRIAIVDGLADRKRAAEIAQSLIPDQG
jgi:predicted dehydrogenase